MENKDYENFSPEMDTESFWTNVVESSTIKYDKKDIKPDIIKQKKWSLIYIILSFVCIIFTVLISVRLDTVIEKSNNIAEISVKNDDLEPIVKKIKTVTKGVNYEDIILNRFLLENLLFVWLENYEIVNKFENFFSDNEVRTKLWSFNVWPISIKKWKEEYWLVEYDLKIEWKFQQFNQDLKLMVSFLNKMKPVIIVDEIKFMKWNNVNFMWRFYVYENSLIRYDYWSNAKAVNEILRLKEEYNKNNIILDRILQDRDINFEKLGINKIYNCQQYERILDKQNLIKETEIDQCKWVEDLVKSIKVELDTKFNSLIK